MNRLLAAWLVPAMLLVASAAAFAVDCHCPYQPAINDGGQCVTELFGIKTCTDDSLKQGQCVLQDGQDYGYQTCQLQMDGLVSLNTYGSTGPCQQDADCHVISTSPNNEELAPIFNTPCGNGDDTCP